MFMNLKTILKNFLDFKNIKESFLIGTGNLGLAIAKYHGFEKYGLSVSALFDNDPHKVGLKIGNKEVFHVSRLSELVKKMQIKIMILAVPASEAQKNDKYRRRIRIKAIWNFAPININVPKDVLVINQDLAADFVVLSLQFNNLEL